MQYRGGASYCPLLLQHRSIIFVDSGIDNYAISLSRNMIGAAHIPIDAMRMEPIFDIGPEDNVAGGNDLNDLSDLSDLSEG
jgi:hypothetical protein